MSEKHTIKIFLLIVLLCSIFAGASKFSNMELPQSSDPNIEYDGCFTWGDFNYNGMSYSAGENPFTYATGSGYTTIVDNFDDHFNIIESKMSSGNGYKEEIMMEYSPTIGNQTVEWWWAFEDVTAYTWMPSPNMWIYTDTDLNPSDHTGVVYINYGKPTGGNDQFYVTIASYSEGIQYKTAANMGIDLSNTVNANTFYHFKVVFDYDTNHIIWAVNGKQGWRSESVFISNLAMNYGNITKFGLGSGFSYTDKHWIDSLSWTWNAEYNEDDLRNPVNSNSAIILVQSTEGFVKKSNTLIDIDIDLSYIDTVLYNWDGFMNQTWDSPYITFLPSGETIHRIYIYVNTSSEYNIYAIYQFIVDDTYPVIQIGKGTQNSNRSGSLIELEVSDLYLKRVLIHWDSDSYVSLSSPFLTYKPSGNGVHILYIYAEDHAGNEYTTTFEFYTEDPESSDLWIYVLIGIVITTGIIAITGILVSKRKRTPIIKENIQINERGQLITCPDCGNKNQNNVFFCVYCGKCFKGYQDFKNDMEFNFNDRKFEILNFCPYCGSMVINNQCNKCGKSFIK